MLNRNELINKLADNLKKYSPVIIIGNSGTGKTHMLKALMNSLNDKKARILTSEEIFISIIEGIKNGANKSEWKNSLHEQTVLLIDDIDYLKNKDHTQEELLLVLKSSNKPVVATSEKPLNNECFSNAFISYFSEGACVYLDTLDLDTQKEYLRKCIFKNALDLTEDATEWIYKQNFPDYAAIQGFVKTVHLYSRQNQQTTLGECQKLLFQIKQHWL